MPVAFDPTDSAFIENPYPALSNLRERSRIVYDDRLRLNLVTRLDDVKAGLRHPDLGRVHDQVASREELGLTPRDPRWEAFWDVERWSLLELEPPDHTRLRRLIAGAFTVRMAEQLRGPAISLANTLLAPLVEKGSMNLLSEFAQPYSIGLIASLLGVPASDGPQLVVWSHAMVKMYELTNSERQAREASEAAAHFDAYITALVRDRVRNPQRDLLSALVHAETEGEKLTERELVSTCIVLLNAGHEATVNTLGNGIVALMMHRGEWEKVVSGAVPPNVAVEEMLRWDSPLQLFERWVLEDGVEVASATLNRGDKVGFLFGSANRDPRQFEAPDEFIVDRGDTRHVGFGAGIHQCLGAPLARLELEIGLEAVVGHFPDMELAEQPRRHQTFVLRGFEEVTLRSDGP